MSKKSPQLRFEGFTDDWEERKLSEIADIMDGDRGKNYPNGDDFSETGHTLFMSATNVTKNGFKFDETQYISEEKSDSLGNGKIIEDDLILTSRGTVGNLALYDADAKRQIPFARINSGMLILRKKQNESAEFVLQYLKSLVGIKQLNLISFGSAQPQITKKDISKYKVQIPNFDEQTKIGTFFKQLDTLITLHQRKLDLLKEQKKGYLQKMFPKNGARVPELRFAGFADDWEERKLRDLFIKGGSGGTPKSTNKAFYDGDIPFLGISDITKSNGFINNTEKHISSDGLNSSAAWIVSKGAISLAMYASVGKLAILNIDAATSQAFYNMIFDDYDLRDLVYQRLNKANELSEWNKLISTGTQSNLNADKVKNFQMYLPKNHDEIKLISTFFKQIDNTIALHQRKLDLLKEQKKGFLQKMFV